MSALQPSVLLWAALALVAFALLMALYALIRLAALRRQVRKLEDQAQRQTTSLLALHGAMKVISEDVIAHSQIQSSVRRTLERLVDEQSALRLREVDDGLYPQAIQMVQSGRSRDEVRELCGLTHAEVDLLFTLHRPSIDTKVARAGSPRSGARD